MFAIAQFLSGISIWNSRRRPAYWERRYEWSHRIQIIPFHLGFISHIITDRGDLAIFSTFPESHFQTAMIQIRNIQLKQLSSKLSLSEHFSGDLNQLIVLERKGSSASWNSAKNEEYRDR